MADEDEKLTIVLDGREIEANKGEMIIAAAERAGTSGDRDELTWVSKRARWLMVPGTREKTLTARQRRLRAQGQLPVSACLRSPLRFLTANWGNCHRRPDT